MTNNNQDAMLLGEYEHKFIDMVIKTYDIIEELDRARDEEFWVLFDLLEAAYFEIEATKNNYYDLLTRDGGTAHGCSLNYEFDYGVYCLDEKYAAIKDKVKRFTLKTM